MFFQMVYHRKNDKNIPLAEVSLGKLLTFICFENLAQECPKTLYSGVL
jgi:hypothetical protein